MASTTWSRSPRSSSRSKPAYIALIAPIVAFVFTLGAGTGFIYYPLIPVIYAVAYANMVRPERPLAVASTASQFAITASPVSAAMATHGRASSTRSASASPTS